jgi:hypothetical protein
MKNKTTLLSFIVITLLKFDSFAQTSGLGLPVVYASGGEGKNKQWIRPSKSELENSLGWIWGPCDNNVGDDVDNVFRASSSLATQGGITYNTNKLHDDDPTTAWVEGKSDYGIGEFLEADVSTLYTTLNFYNGYQKSPKSFLDNSRVKRLMVSENGVNRCIIQLKDEMGSQEILVSKLNLKNINGTNPIKLRFTIVEIYPGLKFKDVAISEIYHSGCCFAAESELYLENFTSSKVAYLKENQTVKFIDAKGKILNLNVKETGTMQHESMIKVVGQNGMSITVSPHHKLYVNSIDHAIAAEFIKTGDILFAVSEEKIEQVNVSKIEKLEGELKTYYFNNIELPKESINWPLKAIINGFIISDEFMDSMYKKKIKQAKF